MTIKQACLHAYFMKNKYRSAYTNTLSSQKNNSCYTKKISSRLYNIKYEKYQIMTRFKTEKHVSYTYSPRQKDSTFDIVAIKLSW